MKILFDQGLLAHFRQIFLFLKRKIDSRLKAKIKTGSKIPLKYRFPTELENC
jgi:hypothetical protein